MIKHNPSNVNISEAPCFLNEEATLFYKGYFGSVQIDEDTIYGRILYINDSVSYEADTQGSLLNEFKSAVDDYLFTCQKIGKEPDRTDFNVHFTRKELECQK